MGLPGQYYDKNISKWYNWHRYYDSTSGRYMQSDPIGLQGGINTYNYVASDPLNRVDHAGLQETGLAYNPLEFFSSSGSSWTDFQDPVQRAYNDLQESEFKPENYELGACVMVCAVLGEFEGKAIDNTLSSSAEKWEKNLCENRRGAKVITNKILTKSNIAGRIFSLGSTLNCVDQCFSNSTALY